MADKEDRTATNRLGTPLPDSVLERFYAEHPEEHPDQKTASGPRSYYVTKGGGKYHTADPATGRAKCNAAVAVDTSHAPITVRPGGEVHPIVCLKCCPRTRRASSA